MNKQIKLERRRERFTAQSNKVIIIISFVLLFLNDVKKEVCRCVDI
jgi:hypothetical protein